MPNEEVKLKPCPFCGGPARPLLGYILMLDDEGNRPECEEDSRVWFGACVYCPECGCEIEKKKKSTRNNEKGWHDKIRQDAVDAWNRRANDAE